MAAQLMEVARHRPSPTHVLQASLTIAANTSETEATRVDALIFVQEMVEDYDVANGTLLDLALPATLFKAPGPSRYKYLYRCMSALLMALSATCTGSLRPSCRQ